MSITFDSDKPEYLPSVPQPHGVFGMGARVQHEVRTLLPYAIGMVLCELLLLAGGLILDTQTNRKPLIYLAYTINGMGLLLWPVTLCTLCLQSFLTEFNDATIAQLIVQPISRRQIWLEKIGITLMVLVPSVSVGFFMFVFYQVFTSQHDTHLPEALAMFGIFVFAYIASILFMAPFIATLLRRSLASLLLLLVYAIAVGAVIFGIGSLIQPNGPSAMLAFWIATVTLLILLAVVTYSVSYHRFLWMEV